MFPNQFCYQIPIQFFSPQLMFQGIQGDQNLNSFAEFQFNQILQGPYFLTGVENNGNFFSYVPCQMQIGQFSQHFDGNGEQNIEVTVPTLKAVDQCPEIQKKQISQKNQTQKVVSEGCICSKTGCIKEYCRCFKNGKACTEQCRCHQCKNLLDSQLNGKQKIKSSKAMKCNCKKSKCSNKYCDCLVAGVACGKQCNCCNCSNH